jgi:hypothetical protein
MARWLRGILILTAAGMIPACGSSGDTFVLTVLPVPTTGTILYVGPQNVLINVARVDPTVILSAIGLKDLVPGEVIRGIDYRADGELFGFGSSNRLYRIDPQTGNCTPIGPLSLAAVGTNFGVDVEPGSNRIRILGDTTENFTLDPNGGAEATNTSLDFAAADPNFGQTPNVVACAYRSSGALFAIDSTLDILVSVSPTLGTLTTIGSLSINVSAAAGFDITAANDAYAALEVAGVTGLYTVTVGTGAVAPVGTLGTGGPIFGFTLVP